MNTDIRIAEQIRNRKRKKKRYDRNCDTTITFICTNTPPIVPAFGLERASIDVRVLLPTRHRPLLGSNAGLLLFLFPKTVSSSESAFILGALCSGAELSNALDPR